MSGLILDRRAKARLTGALIIVIAAVVGVPEVLPGPHAGPAAAVVEVSKSSRPNLPDAPASAQNTPATPVAAPDSASASAAASASTPAAPPQPAPRPPAPPPADGGAPPPGPAAGPRVWSVQLGSFTSRDNAQHLAGELAARGVAAYVSGSLTSGQLLYRVRTPAMERTAAVELAGRLQADGYEVSLERR